MVGNPFISLILGTLKHVLCYTLFLSCFVGNDEIISHARLEFLSYNLMLTIAEPTLCIISLCLSLSLSRFVLWLTLVSKMQSDKCERKFQKFIDYENKKLRFFPVNMQSVRMPWECYTHLLIRNVLKGRRECGTYLATACSLQAVAK